MPTRIKTVTTSESSLQRRLDLCRVGEKLIARFYAGEIETEQAYEETLPVLNELMRLRREATRADEDLALDPMFDGLDDYHREETAFETAKRINRVAMELGDLADVATSFRLRDVAYDGSAELASLRVKFRDAHRAGAKERMARTMARGEELRAMLGLD